MTFFSPIFSHILNASNSKFSFEKLCENMKFKAKIQVQDWFNF